MQRAQGLNARRKLTAGARARYSRRIQLAFLRSAYFFNASRIGCYIASPVEVDTSLVFARAWRAKRQVFAPVVMDGGHLEFVETQPDTSLERNCFGLWEPARGAVIPARELDVVVVPTVAFDAGRQRIGTGGGYFDRSFDWLDYKRAWLPTKLIGFAFECQEVEEIKANPWDIPLYRVFTEK